MSLHGKWWGYFWTKGATIPKAGSPGRNLLLHSFCRQRIENEHYEGWAGETACVHACSANMAAADTTLQLSVERTTMEITGEMPSVQS